MEEVLEGVYGDDDVFDENGDLIDDEELSCCGTRITDTGLCVECGEHC